jgi:hypothetical protein
MAWQLCIYGINALNDMGVFASQSKQWNLRTLLKKPESLSIVVLQELLIL